VAVVTGFSSGRRPVPDWNVLRGSRNRWQVLYIGCQIFFNAQLPGAVQRKQVPSGIQEYRVEREGPEPVEGTWISSCTAGRIPFFGPE
jgi:hypothetical protein